MVPEDCSGSIGTIFARVGNKLVPIVNIKPATFYDETKEYMSPVFSETGELFFNITGKSAKRLQKLIRKDTNKMKRNIRTFHRVKEKIRREKLKRQVG